MSGQFSRLARLASFLLDSSRNAFTDEVPEIPDLVTGSDGCESHGSEPPAAVEGVGESPSSSSLASCRVSGMPASHNAWRHVIERSDPGLLQYTRLFQVMESLNNAEGQCFNLCLCRSKLSSHVLDHCITTIQNLGRQGCLRFKIGITLDPYNRWYNPEYGYASEGFSEMLVVAVLRTMEAAAFLEAVLIREFRGHGLCTNQAGGGEGVSLDHTNLAFVYTVVLWPETSRGLKRPRSRDRLA